MALLSKDQLLAPSTALAYSTSRGCILVARGCALQMYSLDGSLLHSEYVFDFHSIHGIVLVHDDDSSALFFGHKAIVLYDIVNFQKRWFLDNLDDLVLDCCLIPQNGYTLNQKGAYLAIGYAHNFIDIYTIQELLHEVPQRLLRVHHPAVSALFSMTLLCSRDSVHVLSGTAFGEIIAWRVDISSLIISSLTSSVQPELLLQQKVHAGVVLRIKFAEDRQRFATVSDDRTVRVWSFVDDAVVPLMEGWGHTCRVWDVCFTGNAPQEEDKVVSSSEEGDLRVWEISSGRCIIVLRGHGKSCWRVVSIPNTRLIVSSGNDSCIKVWDTELARSVADDNPSTRQYYNIPQAESRGDDTGCRRVNGVSTIKVSPDGAFIILVMLEGVIWRVDELKSNGDCVQWEKLVECSCPVVNADVLFCSDSFQVCCAHPGGKATLYNSQTGVLNTFRAFQLQVINVWFVNSELILASSIKGSCNLFLVNGKPGALDFELLNSLTTERNAIASCCLRLQGHDALVIGDCKGSLTIFNAACNASQHPLQVFHRAHGAEVVTLLAKCRHGFCSLGQDGFINIYAYNGDCSAPFNCKHVCRVSSLPIKSPDYIAFSSFIEEQLSEAQQRLSLIVGGFVGSHYVIRDILQGYELADVEAGGWKRPHDVVCVPSKMAGSQRFMFACPVPIDNDHRLCVISSIRENSNATLPYRYQIGTQLSSLESNCAAVIPADVRVELKSHYVVVGGVDGCVHLYCSESTRELQLVQREEMPHGVIVRTVAACADSGQQGRGIVVAGGGRLFYSIWHYDYSNVFTMPFNHLLTLGCSGCTVRNASQDHRILSLAAISNATGEFTIISGDSRGFLQVLCFFSKDDSVQVLHHVEASTYPILCCALLSLPAKFEDDIAGSEGNALVAVGDSNGIVSLWKLNAPRYLLLPRHFSLIPHFYVDHVDHYFIGNFYGGCINTRLMKWALTLYV